MPPVMSWPEWANHDATSLAALLRRGQISSDELAAQAREAIARVQPSVRAVLEVYAQDPEDPARERWDPRGAFGGVPYLVTDLGPALKGRPRQFGGDPGHRHVPDEDDFLANRLRTAGLRPVGRTATSAFGLPAWVDPTVGGPARHPWDPTRPSGGCAGGSAALVATGAVPMAHALGGAGAIPIDAARHGLVGLKPSRGVFSNAPEDSDVTRLLVGQGCFSRSVRDTATFVDSCRGGAPGEFMPYWHAPEPYARLVQRDPDRLRVALSHSWGRHSACAHAVTELRFVGRLLEALGHEVAWATPTIDVEPAFEALTQVSRIDLRRQLAPRSTVPCGCGPGARRAIPPREADAWRRWGAEAVALELDAGAVQGTINRTARDFARFFETFDVLVAPAGMTATVPGTPSEPLPGETRADDAFGRAWAAHPHAPVAQLAGLPVLSLPLARHENGLPLGILLCGRSADDGRLLQFGAQIERALDGRWNGARLPVIHVTRITPGERP